MGSHQVCFYFPLGCHIERKASYHAIATETIQAQPHAGKVVSHATLS